MSGEAKTRQSTGKERGREDYTMTENAWDGENGEKTRKVLLIGASWDRFGGSFLGDSSTWSYELCSDPVAAVAKLVNGSYDAVLVERGFFENVFDRGGASEERRILENLPVGLVLVDDDQQILWFNRQFREWCVTDDLHGKKFYIPLGRPELKGPDYCPFRTIRISGKPSSTVLYQQDSGRFLQMNVSSVRTAGKERPDYLVELHDVTLRSRKEIKQERLREAGKELADLSKKDILDLSHEQRTNFLRAKIVKFVKEILQFDTIEVRVVSELHPDELIPLVAVGMAEEAKRRRIFISQEGNGITGWVAYHGKSYRMDDPSEDIFFREGFPGAQSSITVPLLYRGEVIGTFNVESRQVGAFGDNDLHLLETFAEDLALAIHTLDLLSFEQKDSAYRSIEKVYDEIVEPVNRILNECARLLRDGLNDPEEVAAMLADIQAHAREILAVFQKRGEEAAGELPPEKSDVDCRNFPVLRDRRILLVDADTRIGRQLSRLLFFYGCVVETAQGGNDALTLLRTAPRYDAIICNVRLKDMSAYTFFEQVGDLLQVPFVPMIYMKGYGHDGEHVLTRAKVAGVLGYIGKPFNLPQLLRNLKLVITEAEAQNEVD